MLRSKILSSLLALGVLGAFTTTTFAQKHDDKHPADKMAPASKMAPAEKKAGPARDEKGRFIKKTEAKKPADKMAPAEKKAGPARDEKGRFIKKTETPKPTDKMAPAAKMSGEGKMAGAAGGKMAGAADKMAPAGKPVWDAKSKKWRLNGKFISEAEAMKLGGKK